MAIPDEKKLLRKQVRERKARLSAEAAAWASADIIAQVEALPAFAGASTVLAYWSMADEVQTHEAVARWSASKRVLLPVVVGDGLVLRQYGAGSMMPGYRGILEPGPDSAAAAPEEVELAIIPGMAFDVEGHRLGRGGGYYDRLLPQLRCMKLGVCYDCQFLASVPCEKHDCKVDKVVTNRK